jgi:hypothetical protein
MSILTTAITTTVAGFLIMLWAWCDVARRPDAMFRAAHVKKYPWLFGFSALAVVMISCGIALAVGTHASSVFGKVGLALSSFGWLGLVGGGFAGLVLGGWYLAIVRPWVAVQMHFARR